MIRRLIAPGLVPLAILATAFASTPWLRAFPAAVISVPLYGAALISVLVPLVAVSLLPVPRLWLTALIDVAAFAVYTLVVVLHAPLDFGDFVSGLVHGPAQLLTFALPLVSPRSLSVAPVALCWLAGALAGECLARRWTTGLPYLGWLVAFGLSYAATERAASDDLDAARTYETLMAVALLVAVLLLRTAQAWVRQDTHSEATQADAVLPLRSLAAGVAVTAVAAVVASVFVQAPLFTRRAAVPERVPPVVQSTPVEPLSFIAGLRPKNPIEDGQRVFSVTFDRPGPSYVGIASVDSYDGMGWSFRRTFRPSGGVMPAESDRALRAPGPSVGQHYEIADGPLTTAPWMPSLFRAQKVTGRTVNIDEDSGMIVPAAPLRGGDSYTVRSTPATAGFEQLPVQAQPVIGDVQDTTLPAALGRPLNAVVAAFERETRTTHATKLTFLRALAKTLRTRYALAGAPASSADSTQSLTTRRAGSTSFADVVSAIQQKRVATPEQYATLFALVARQISVPARVVTGFRVVPRPSVAAGAHEVTANKAWTWVEIPVSGSGWVVVDPSPTTYAQARDPSSPARPAPNRAPPTADARLTPADGGHAVAPPTAFDAASDGDGSLVVRMVIGVVGLVVLVLAWMLLRKGVRRSRRRSHPDPRRRLLGAWQESLDLLTEAGLPDLSTLTSAEVAEAATGHFGTQVAEHASNLGQAANAAMYHPSAAVTVDDADRAWAAYETLRAQVRAQLSPRQLVRAGLSYHRPGSRAH